MSETPIRVWAFCEAPEELRELSPHGGDEDWLAAVPREYEDSYIEWLDRGPFGICDISKSDVIVGGDFDGYRVYIGAHS